MKYITDLKIGLKKEEVEERIRMGQVNHLNHSITKSYSQIIKDNVCTLFNMINLVLACLVLFTGSLQNLLFLGVVLCNIAVGMIQEVRSKHMLDRISLIHARKVSAVRDGKLVEINDTDVVRDDLLMLSSGNQIICDAIVASGTLEVNEALISGESEPVLKKQGDLLYAGSYVSSGSARVQVMKVGAESYANQISMMAKRYRKYPSELRNSLNAILKYVGIMIIPMGLAMFAKEFFITKSSLTDAILQTSASVIGMIPEGLFFLTSISLAAGVIALLKKNTLIQEMYGIESLARVDMLCLDKTGTITTGSMTLSEVIPYESDEKIELVLKNIVSCAMDKNATMEAIEKQFPAASTMHLKKSIPFSSERKYSGAEFEEGCFLLGAYEYLFPKDEALLKEDIAYHAYQGKRVLILVKHVDDVLLPMALLLLEDEIRKDAEQTFSYFYKEGVSIKVISGDDPMTVSAIAMRSGIKGADQYVDASKLTTKKEIEAAMKQFTVFGRVSPQQKKDMILALKKQNHTVAMTGDGVNDVLAFKEADCSIAMAAGSDIAKNTASLILLTSDFSSLPNVLLEGRRVINNIERASSLFLTKTIYSFLLSVLVLLSGIAFPFVPIHLSFISAFTIGIPGFFLALEPNKDRVQGHFIRNVLSSSLPGACAVTACILIAIRNYDLFSINNSLSYFALITILVNGLLLLYRVARPFNFIKSAIFLFSVIGLSIGFLFFKDLLFIDAVNAKTTLFFTAVIMMIQLPVTLCVSYLMKPVTIKKMSSGWKLAQKTFL